MAVRFSDFDTATRFRAQNSQQQPVSDCRCLLTIGMGIGIPNQHGASVMHAPHAVHTTLPSLAFCRRFVSATRRACIKQPTTACKRLSMPVGNRHRASAWHRHRHRHRHLHRISESASTSGIGMGHRHGASVMHTLKALHPTLP